MHCDSKLLHHCVFVIVKQIIFCNYIIAFNGKKMEKEDVAGFKMPLSGYERVLGH